MTNFYAYLYLRQDGTPYYAGMGRGSRAFNRTNHRVPTPLDNSRILILKRSSEQEAIETEKELIRNWGRIDLGTGCLRNLTEGGEGCNHSEEVRKRMRGPKSEDHRRAMSEAAKRRWRRSSERLKLVEAQKKYAATPEGVARNSEAGKKGAAARWGVAA